MENTLSPSTTNEEVTKHMTDNASKIVQSSSAPGGMKVIRRNGMVTPYDDIKALESGNQAVGTVSAGVLVSLGLLMLNSFWGDFLGYDIMLVNFVIWFFGGLTLLLAFRAIGSRILFPKSNLVKEIYDDNNVGAASIMAVAYVIIATVIVLSF